MINIFSKLLLKDNSYISRLEPGWVSKALLPVDFMYNHSKIFGQILL